MLLSITFAGYRETQDLIEEILRETGAYEYARWSTTGYYCSWTLEPTSYSQEVRAINIMDSLTYGLAEGRFDKGTFALVITDNQGTELFSF